jgi:hypothetical protein
MLKLRNSLNLEKKKGNCQVGNGTNLVITFAESFSFVGTVSYYKTRLTPNGIAVVGSGAEVA